MAVNNMLECVDGFSSERYNVTYLGQAAGMTKIKAHVSLKTLVETDRFDLIFKDG